MAGEKHPETDKNHTNEFEVDLPSFESEHQSYFTVIAALVMIIVAIFIILLIFDYLYGNPAPSQTSSKQTSSAYKN